jgi:16S rRNA (uracil1498-N3)-methyltransferase
MIPAVRRRLHIATVRNGTVELDGPQAHHLAHVLRLEAGAEVEVFDDAGRCGRGVLVLEHGRLGVEVREIIDRPPLPGLTIASAVPKGARADWMIEKLTELGVARFIPLRTGRSVVHPEGEGKPHRWQRLAREAARQCGRADVMTIEALTPLDQVLAARPGAGWYATTSATGRPQGRVDIVLVGPEGGWTVAEETALAAAGLKAVSLGPTVLRIETAAVAAAVLAGYAAGAR